MLVDLDNLADPETASDEDYKASIDSLLNQPVSDEDNVPNTNDDIEAEPDETVEQSKDDTVEPESEDDDQNTVDPTYNEPTDSTNEDKIVADDNTANDSEPNNTGSEVDKEEVKPNEFNFKDMPMDEMLPFEIKAAGTSVKASLNELIAGFKKGMGFTKNMQQIAPFRRSISIMEDNGLSEADLNMLVEAKSGNKQALAKLLSDANIDAFDIEDEEIENYTPADYGKDIPDPAMEQVKSEINSDTEYVSKVENAIDTMPQDFYDLVSGDARALNSLYGDIKNGSYDAIMPEVIKQQALYGSDLPTVDLYIQIAKQISQQNVPQKQEVNEPKATPKQDSKEQRRKASSGTKKVVSGVAPKKLSEKIDDMDKDDFAKNFKKMTGIDMDSLRNQ